MEAFAHAETVGQTVGRDDKVDDDPDDNLALQIGAVANDSEHRRWKTWYIAIHANALEPG